MAATETKTEALNRLFKENGLLKEDWFEHSQYRIITRSGIEKIQGKNNVTVKFEAVTMTPAFCVVKAIATKPTGDLLVETFGSAGFQADGNFPKNKGFQYLYFPELAEKRALSRAVLKIMGLYSMGVFSEDESEDFQKANQPKNSEPVIYATGVQKAEINRLIEMPCFTSGEVTKIIISRDTLTEKQADKVIAKLAWAAQEREEGRAGELKAAE